MKSNSNQPSGGRRRAAIGLITASLVLSGLIRLLSNPGRETGGTKGTNPTPAPDTMSAAGGKPAANPSAARALPPLTAITALDNTPNKKLEQFASEFRALSGDKSLSPASRREKARSLLARLREALRNAPADEAAAAIVALLNSGRDEATGLGFSLEGGGTLADAPSLRTALLDLLGQFDPAMSVACAQTIFNGSTVADEWALAMRNLGWQNGEGTHSAELRTRLEQLLDNAAWLAHPTEGFFEAFDTAVHLGGTADFAGMASVLKLEDSSGRPVENGATHAAYVALDRITAGNPDQALTQLAGDPSLLAWAPQHRGSLMARADVRQPAQLAAVETYLSTLATHPAELETFTSMFPNRNGLRGNALITTAPPDVPHDDLVDGDRAALDAVNAWIQGGRFPALDSSLRQISSRLSGFLADTRDAGER